MVKQLKISISGSNVLSLWLDDWISIQLTGVNVDINLTAVKQKKEVPSDLAAGCRVCRTGLLGAADHRTGRTYGMEGSSI